MCALLSCEPPSPCPLDHGARGFLVAQTDCQQETFSYERGRSALEGERDGEGILRHACAQLHAHGLS